MNFYSSRKVRFINFLFLTFIVFFLFGFYFTGMESSKHSSGVRFGLFLLLFVILLSTSLKEVSGCLKSWYLKLELRVKVFIFLFLLMFFYYILRSFSALEFSELRRLVVIFLFISLVSWFLIALDFRFDKVVYSLGLLGFLLGLSFLFNNILFGEYALKLEPLRISTSGYEWFSSYSNTIIAGLFYTYLLVACVWSYLNSKRIGVIFFYYSASILVVFAIFHTAARTAWLASVVSLTVLFFFYLQKEKKKLAALYMPNFVVAILYPIFNYQGVVREGLTYRDKIWIDHLKEMSGILDWLFGKGLSADMSFVDLPWGIKAAHPHSLYIESLYTGGVIGLLLFVSMLIALFYCLIKRARSSVEISFILSVLSGVAVAMAFDFSGLFYTPNLVWLWLWFTVALAMREILTSKGNCVRARAV